MNYGEVNRVANESTHDPATVPQLSRQLELLASFLPGLERKLLEWKSL